MFENVLCLNHQGYKWQNYLCIIGCFCKEEFVQEFVSVLYVLSEGGEGTVNQVTRRRP